MCICIHYVEIIPAIHSCNALWNNGYVTKDLVRILIVHILYFLKVVRTPRICCNYKLIQSSEINRLRTSYSMKCGIHTCTLYTVNLEIFDHKLWKCFVLSRNRLGMKIYHMNIFSCWIIVMQRTCTLAFMPRGPRSSV